MSKNTIYKLPFGLCPEYVSLGVLVLRSYGVPVVSEYTPLWGKSDTGHSWYTILNNDGTSQSSAYDISSHFGSTLFPTKDIPKIYRKTYARNRKTEEYFLKAKYKHPSIELFQIDVTDEYRATSDLEIPLNKKNIYDNYVYIASFNGKSWQPLDFGIIKDNRGLFSKMGRNILYIALSYDGIQMHPASSPFILHTNGDIDYLTADTSQLETIKLWRKYPRNHHVACMEERMIGGKIQGANKRDFSDSVTLFLINNLNYTDPISFNNSSKFRYWRYLSPPEAYGNIAELTFFSKEGKAIRGTIMGTEGDLLLEIEKAFDDNWLTFYDTWTDKPPWVGMDFERPIHIDKVRCIPRSDDNKIHYGDEYELKYWSESGWQSLGTKVADDSSISYNRVPQNALLWLSNLTRGKQERVFIYEEGKQVWW